MFECFVSVDFVVFDKIGIFIEGCFSIFGIVVVCGFCEEEILVFVVVVEKYIVYFIGYVIIV